MKIKNQQHEVWHAMVYSDLHRRTLTHRIAYMRWDMLLCMVPIALTCAHAQHDTLGLQFRVCIYAKLDV